MKTDGVMMSFYHDVTKIKEKIYIFFLLTQILHSQNVKIVWIIQNIRWFKTFLEFSFL